MADPSISIAPLERCARFAVRLREAAATFPFGTPINTCVVADRRTIARLGPDEWLLLGPDGERAAIDRELNELLHGRFFSLVDISHRHAAFEVAGAHATVLINGGCPLDLHDTAFPPHSATRTLLDKAEIVLLRAGEEPRYRIECWRSFAPYVLAFLKNAAREFESS